MDQERPLREKNPGKALIRARHVGRVVRVVRRAEIPAGRRRIVARCRRVVIRTWVGVTRIPVRSRVVKGGCHERGGHKGVPVMDMPPVVHVLAMVEVLAMLDVRAVVRSEEHTSELQSQSNLVCRLLLEKKK